MSTNSGRSLRTCGASASPADSLAVMMPSLAGKRLVAVDLEYTLVLRLSGVYVVAISSPLTVEYDGGRIRLDPEDGDPESFGPVHQLVGRTVEAAVVDRAGALDVTFDTGARLRVEPDPHYEAWNVSGPDGALVVSMPGGELAVWTASPEAKG